MAQQMTVEEFLTAYCERQEQTSKGLLDVLKAQIQRFNSDGFMLLECQVMDSSQLGKYVVLGFGGTHTFKEIPAHPISPRGLASDMSTVKGWVSRGQIETAS